MLYTVTEITSSSAVIPVINGTGIKSDGIHIGIKLNIAQITIIISIANASIIKTITTFSQFG